jgi:hypothetical protein
MVVGRKEQSRIASLPEAEMLESVVSLSAAFWSWLEWLMKMAGSHK